MSTQIPQEIPRFARLRVENYFVFDSILLMFYTAIVYGWGLTVYPMGRDFAAMHSKGADLPFLADRIFAWEVQTFGAWVVPYHLVNVIVLYGCLWCVMHLTTFTVRGLWWIGTWAAVVFMANPIHTESVLNLSGIGDLVPAFFALLALTAYSYHAYRPLRWKYALAIATFAFAVAAYPHHAFLFIIVVMFEVLITRPENRRFPRLIPFMIMGVIALIYHWPVLSATKFDFATWFAPLYFTFYPIGLLPENAVAMHHRPWLGWCAAVAVAVILWLIYRKARRPAILFAVLSMFVMRMFPTARPIDPVHLIGGGELIVASAMFTIAFAALAYRCMDHPKWKVPIVGMTTALAAAVVLVQIRAELNWRAAGKTVKAFQGAAEREADAPLAVLPDWQYYRGAPVMLSESIRYDTPFSRALDPQPILMLNAISLDNELAALESWRASGGAVRIDGARPIDVMPWPYEARKVGDAIAIEGGTGAIRSIDDDGFSIEVTGSGFPSAVLPAIPSLGKEAAAETQSDASDQERDE